MAVATARVANLKALPPCEQAFDNNQAERALRMMKLRQRISGTFRNVAAPANCCRIRGYIATAKPASRRWTRCSGCSGATP